MKILYLCHSCPHPKTIDALANRVYHLIKILSEIYNHKITLITFKEDTQSICEIKTYCEHTYTIQKINSMNNYIKNYILNLIYGYIPLENKNFFDVMYSNKMQNFLNQIDLSDYEVVLVSDVSMLPYMKHITVPTIITEVENYPEVHYDAIKKERRIFKKLLRLLLYISSSINEKNLNKLNLCITVTKEQKDILCNKYNSINVSSIPFGIDIDNQIIHVVDDNQPSITFIGNMDSVFNQESALLIINKIFPLVKKNISATKLFIIGKNPPPEIKKLERIKDIFVLGYIEDLRPYLSKSSISILPIHGHGIKTRFFPIMATGTPIITFPTAIKGINVTPDVNIILANNCQEFVNKAVELLTNQDLRESIGMNAQKLMETEYSWEKIGGDLHQYIIEIHHSSKYDL